MTQSGSEERKTSTILAMDVASYSQKMGVDEEGTLKQLKACREIIEAKVSDAKGRIFNTAGDAFMVEFSNTLSAVNAAILIQREISEHNKEISDSSKRLYFRMGINLGDVMVDGDNLLGDGVNIAARLESIAPPGGICISEIVHATVKGKLDCGIIEKGQQRLKNIADPVKAYYLDIKTGEVDPKKFKTPTEKNKSTMYFGGVIATSIAALLFVINPFKEESLNLNTIVISPIKTTSTNEDQVNLVAGLTQDIISNLSRSSKKLNVVSLNTTDNSQLQTLAKKAGARYLISGNLRKSSDNIRVSMNLIDVQNMTTVWSENFDKKSNIENIFILQDDIVAKVIDALVGSGEILAKEVVKVVSSSGSQSMDAYACVNFVRNEFLKKVTLENFERSRNCLQKSTEVDPNYAEAWQYYSYILMWGYNIMKMYPKEILSEALDAAEEAIKLDPNYAEAYATKAQIEYHYKNFVSMEEAVDKAISLAPNDAHVLGKVSYLYGLSGWGCHASDQLKKKYDIDERACYRLKKGHEIGTKSKNLDPYNNVMYHIYGRAPLYQDSKDWKNLLAVMEEQPANFMWWHHYMGTANHHLGRKDQAKKYFTKVKELLGGVNTIEALKKEAEIWHEMTVIEEMMPVYLEYGLD